MFLLIAFLVGLSAFANAEVVNAPVVNLYIQPKEGTEIDTQAIYGSFVEVVVARSDDDWCKIRMPDGVEGWVRSFQITHNSVFENSENLRPVKNLFANIYRVTDTTPFPPLMTIPYGSRVKLDQVDDTAERWIAIELASGEKAWIQRGDVDFAPKLKTLEETIEFSKKFLGLPYTWGGTSTYGFDCSGFMQMLFKEMGISLPRNSRAQATSDSFLPIEKTDLQRGDLVFFGESRITHVGLYLGNDEFIAASVRDMNPVVMISNLNTTKYNYYTARRIKPF